MLNFHQFYSANKYRKGYAQGSKATFSPTGNSKKASCSAENLKKLKIEHFSIFFKNASGKSHSAESHPSVFYVRKVFGIS